MTITPHIATLKHAISPTVSRRVALAALRVSESRYRRLFETARDGILLLNADTAQIEDVNPYLIEMLGYSHHQFLGKKLWEVGAFADIAQSKEMFAELQSTGYVRYDDLPLRRADGGRLDVEFVSNVYECEGIRVIQCNVRDISERQAAVIQVENERSRLRTLLTTIPDMVWLKDADGGYLACNPAFEKFFGVAEAAIVGRTDHDFVPADQADLFRTMDRAAMIAAQPTLNEEWLTFASDGHRALMQTIKTPMLDAATNRVGVLGIARDITLSKLAEAEIQSLAFYDPLTTLPNRRLLLDRLARALAASGRSGREGALLFIDLDNFKTLNDSLGHDKGDLLLQQVGQRLLTCVRDSDTVARLGGDEFVVMLEDLGEKLHEAANQTEAVGLKILAALSQPYQLGDHQHRSTASIGATLFKSASRSVDELLKRADIAMYQAKGAGRATLRFFDPELQVAIAARAALEAELDRAIRDDQLVLYYQPQLDGGGRVTGAEALVRWRHPMRGLVSPADFIPLAEETGQIVALGRWVLDSACRQLVAWNACADTAPLILAVNVSPAQFRQPAFVEEVLSIVRRSGVDPHKLKLELTESMLLDNVEDIIAKMNCLKECGIRFSLDDFGTGYSSLSYLKRLPLHQLKIDQSFVRDVLTDANDAAIARTIIALADSLGLSVIAEGVETEVQRAFLETHGCAAYQGYLFSRPVPIASFDQRVADCAKDRIASSTL